jgi:Flp pilus assembly protein TadG
MRIRFWHREDGSSAAEFALVLPVVVGLTLGVMNLCAAFWAQTSLANAADQAARYWAVANAGMTIADAASENASPTAPNLAVVVTKSTAQTWALSHYLGPHLSSIAFTGILPSATGTTTGNCQQQSGTASGVTGYVVTGTGTYRLNWIFGSTAIALKAEACYPFIG